MHHLYTLSNMYRDWVCWVEVKGKAVDGRREKRPVGLAMSESREVQKIRSAPPVCVCVCVCVCICVCLCDNITMYPPRDTLLYCYG